MPALHPWKEGLAPPDMIDVRVKPNPPPVGGRANIPDYSLCVAAAISMTCILRAVMKFVRVIIDRGLETHPHHVTYSYLNVRAVTEV